MQLKLAVEDLVAQDELRDLACRRCAIITDHQTNRDEVVASILDWIDQVLSKP